MKKNILEKAFPFLSALVISCFLLLANYTLVFSATETFKSLVKNKIISGILDPVVVLLIALAVVFFLWGVFKFMIAEGDKKEEGKEFMLWGIIGIFVMVSVWGLVNILVKTFKLDSTELDIPQV